MDKLIEIGFSLGLLVNALLFIPQAVKLYRNKQSEDVSLITFIGFWLIQLFVILHGLIKQDLLLTFGTLCSMLTCGVVIALIIFYRINPRNDIIK